LAAQLLLGKIDAVPVGHLLDDDVLVDDEMESGVMGYVNFVRALGIDPRAVTQVEKSLPGDPLGIRPVVPDSTVFTDGTLHIIEFKYGFRAVSARENLQLLCYLLCMIGIKGVPNNTEHVKFHIIQPRSFTTNSVRSSWSFEVRQIAGVAESIRRSVEAIKSGSTMSKTGDHCLYCTNHQNCEAYYRMVGDAVEIAENSQFSRSLAKDASCYIVLRRALSIIKGNFEMLGSDINDGIWKGKRYPGIVGYQGKSHAHWTDRKVVSILAEASGVDIKKKEEIVTPLQAKSRGLSSSIIERFTEVKPGQLKIGLLNAKEILNGTTERKT